MYPSFLRALLMAILLNIFTLSILFAMSNAFIEGQVRPNHLKQNKKEEVVTA
jgi:hypothetical protein